MKPFDLNAALDGAKLVTKGGRPARIICWDRQHASRFVWLETSGNNGQEYVAAGDYETLCKFLRLADDESVEQHAERAQQVGQTPRPHAELIHAWADGAEIQYLHAGFWWLTDNPQWHEATQFRIKPNEPQWYENIPEHGRLCWVQDELHHEKAITIIIQYDETFEYKFISFRNNRWRCATPLTNDEIKQFLR